MIKTMMKNKLFNKKIFVYIFEIRIK
jgi:hypothetical protein